MTALTLNPQSGICTYSGAIANGVSGMSLTKSGAGTQVLAGTNTYTGETNVTGGTLVVDGSLGPGYRHRQMPVRPSAVTASSAAPVIVNGTLVPGHPVGTLTINNNLTCAAGSIWAYHLGANSDLIAVNAEPYPRVARSISQTPAGFATNTYTLFTYSERWPPTTLSSAARRIRITPMRSIPARRAR